MSRAVGVMNGNFRNGIYTGYGSADQVREIDRLSAELEKIIGKQAAWEFARDLTVKGEEARAAAYKVALQVALCWDEAYDFNAFVDQCAEDGADSADHADTVGYCNQGF